MNTKTILLADDDQDDQEFFLEALSEFASKFKCIVVENGMQVLNYLKSSDVLPDYIFLDLNMPLMDGKKCLCEIKKEKKFSEIPVIIYSTAHWNIIVDEMKHFGADYYLEKPIQFKVLQQNISDILNGKMKRLE